MELASAFPARRGLQAPAALWKGEKSDRRGGRKVTELLLSVLPFNVPVTDLQFTDNASSIGRRCPWIPRGIFASSKVSTKPGEVQTAILTENVVAGPHGKGHDS